MEQAVILAIGDELLNGLVPDRNASYIGRRLTEIGFEVLETRIVPDRSSSIREAIEAWEGNVGLIMMTGGLGPTDDDLTKSVLSSYYGTALQRDERIEQDLKEYLEKRGRTLTERDLEQADMPEGASVFRNLYGSAPAIRFDRHGTTLIALPGVPHEMRVLMEEQVLPSLTDTHGVPPIPIRSVVTAGSGESMLVREIEDIVERYEEQGMAFSYLASPGSVRIRMMDPGERGEELLDEAVAALQERIPEHFVGVGNAPFEELIGKHLKASGASLATAESCTGGYIAHLLTSVAGSSEYFSGSVIAYSNELKKVLLGVSEELLEKEGAVSQQVVEHMAAGVRRTIGADIGLATSGIMGPTGGSTEKPVGTVWMAVAIGDRVFSERHFLGQQRVVNIEKAARSALNLLRKKLQNL